VTNNTGTPAFCAAIATSRPLLSRSRMSDRIRSIPPALIAARAAEAVSIVPTTV